MRLSASRILIFIVNILLGNKTSDPMSGFFIFKKEIFIRNKYKLFNKGYKILMDLIYLDGKYQKIYDVKINFANRKKGESKMNMKILISLINLTPEFQFGIFLLVIMPSAAMSNYETKLVDANVTLSITLR